MLRSQASRVLTALRLEDHERGTERPRCLTSMSARCGSLCVFVHPAPSLDYLGVWLSWREPLGTGEESRVVIFNLAWLTHWQRRYDDQRQNPLLVAEDVSGVVKASYCTGKRSIDFYCCGWMHSGRRFGPFFLLVVGLITAALRCMCKRVGVARSWLGTWTMSGKPTRLISV